MLYYALCLSYHSNTEAVLFAFRQAGPPQRVDYLAPLVCIYFFPLVTLKRRKGAITWANPHPLKS